MIFETKERYSWEWFSITLITIHLPLTGETPIVYIGQNREDTDPIIYGKNFKIMLSSEKMGVWCKQTDMHHMF